MSERPPLLRVVLWLAIVLLAVYLVLIGGTYLGIESLTWQTLSTILAAGVLGVWLGVAIVRPAWRPRSALWPAIVACLGAFVVCSALSWDPTVSLELTAYAALLTGLYLLAVRLMSDAFFRPRFGALALALCATICVAYLGTVMLAWADWWRLVGRVTIPPLRPNYEGLTFQTPNVVATVVVLLFAIAAAHIGWGGRPQRLALGALAVLVAAVVLVTASRGAWAGVAVGVVALLIVWVADQGARDAARKKLKDRRTALIAGGAGLVVVAVGAVLVPRLLSRFAAGGEGLRLGFISAALRMFSERPLFGSGPGTWVIRRAAFTQPGEPDLYIPHAHDIYAQTAAEFGLVGLAAGVLLVGGLLWLVRGAVRDTDPVRRRFGLATLFALVFLGVQQLVDFFANLPSVLLPLAVLVAALDATADRPFLADRLPAALRPRLARLRFQAGALGLSAVVVLTGFALAKLAVTDGVATTGRQAVLALDGGDVTAAAALAATATADEPSIATYPLTLGLALAATDAATARPAAESALQLAAEHDLLAETWLDVAALRADAGDRPGAADALDHALRLGIQRPSVALPAGAVWLRIDEQDRARDAFAAAVAAAPSLAADGYWRSTPELTAIAPSVMAAATARATPSYAWEIALVTGDPSEPSRRDGLLPGPREEAATVALAWAGDAAARAALVERAVADPLDDFAVGWSARLASRAGDREEASRFRRWVATIDPALAGSVAFDRRIVIGPDVATLSVADNAAAAYGQATYRRVAPADLLLARLPHVVLAP